MAIEKTYSMIKPDGVRNGHIGEIVNRFERAGLKIERMEMGMVTPEQAAANYQEHEGKPFYDGLISYITSGPVVKMVVSGEGAVAKCRSLMGATNPAEAAPGTIRGDFGLIMAGAALAAVPIIIIFLIFQKYFTKGIAMGAVKG